MPEYINNQEVQTPYGFPDGRRFGMPQQIKHLAQYTAYYRFDGGDTPVTIVASSIKEAAKLASMPGVMGNDAIEPIQIKFDGKTVGVAMPVSMISFDTIIKPEGAKIAGATATPEHFEVRNGENVIFQAHEPFGYRFDGWYKGDQLLSSDLISEIDVYDNYATKLLYEARYAHEPKLRSGRYLDLTRGNIITLSMIEDPAFLAQVEYVGKAVWDGGSVAAYNAIVKKDGFTLPTDSAPGVISFLKDPTITQPGNFSLTGSWTFSPVGFNIVVSASTLDNAWGYVSGSVLSLQWISPLI
jgi:hypothetical protein